ncbi:MAG: tail fiber protein [Bacteroidota bacterium]
MSNIEMPIGSIVMYAGDLIPQGWCRCNKQEITRKAIGDANFDELAKALNIDPAGKSSLLLPDMQNRFPVGAGQDAHLGALGGPDPHTHKVEQFEKTYDTSKIGNHSHKYASSWYKRDFSSGKYSGIDTGGGNVKKQKTQAAGAHKHTVNVTIEERTTSEYTGLNRPKYYAVNFIIRVG